MCGIVGLVALSGNIEEPGMKFFEKLLYHDTIRGPHSTGVMGWAEDDLIYWDKQALPGPEYLECDTWESLRKRFLKPKGGQAVNSLIGHNRWATMGAVTKENAHPFIENKLMLVHNGTLRHGDVPKKLLKKMEVDSRALTFMLGEQGVDKVLPELEGAWALAWYDLEKRTLNFARNEDRPLATCKVMIAGRPHQAIASEKNMLEWLIERSKGVFVPANHTAGKVPTYKHIQYRMDPPKEGIKVAESKEIEDNRIPFNYGNYQNYGWEKPAAKSYRRPTAPKSGGHVELVFKTTKGTEVKARMNDRVKFLPHTYEGYVSTQQALTKKGKLMGHVYPPGKEEAPIVEGIEATIYGVPATQGEDWAENSKLLVASVQGKAHEGTMLLSALNIVFCETHEVNEQTWALTKKKPKKAPKGIVITKEEIGKKGTVAKLPKKEVVSEKKPPAAPEKPTGAVVPVWLCIWCDSWKREVTVMDSCTICHECQEDYLNTMGMPGGQPPTIN